MHTRHFWIACLLCMGLAVCVWAASPRGQAPPPQAHADMKVPPAAERLHNELERVTQAAAKKGEYVCCINPPCEFCAVHMAACPCGKNLAAGKPVCRECKGGWHVGEGRIAGIKPENVKAMSTQQVMQMMKSGKKPGKPNNASAKPRAPGKSASAHK